MAKKSKIHRPLLYALLVFLRAMINLMPYSWGIRFGGWMGSRAYRLIHKQRERTLNHLRMVFEQEKSEREIQRIAESVFVHFGYLVAELAMVDKIIRRLDHYVSVEGTEHFDEALRNGNGIVAVVAHFGNWELMGGAMALKGYPSTVIAKRIYYKKYDELLTALRAKMKLETVYQDQFARRVLRALRGNRIVGFVVDQDLRQVDGVFADFFGRPAFTPTAPVRFAAATGAALIPIFSVREGLRHRIVIEPAIELSQTGDREADIAESTQRWVAVQEKFIRLYPEQWAWHHPRWNTVPKPSILSEISR